MKSAKELGVHGIGSPIIIDSSGPCFGIGGSPSDKLDISGEVIMEKVMEQWNGKCPSALVPRLEEIDGTNGEILQVPEK